MLADPDATEVPVNPAPFSKRIFGIGLNKTGTKSLASALNFLGIKTHHGYLGRHLRMESQLGVPVASTFSQYQAICDFHTIYRDSMFPRRRIYVFEELDRLYPGAKFVLTSRDLKSWLKSRELHVKRNQANPRYTGDFLRVEKGKWRRLWKHYHATVRRHFEDRPKDILYMNIIDGDGWDQLCPFLGLAMPDISFPRLNVANEKKVARLRGASTAF